MLACSLWADVKSTSGNIHFFPVHTGPIEMTLDHNGLGLGVTQPSANLHVAGNALLGDLQVDGGANVSTFSINGMSFPLSVGSTNQMLTFGSDGNLHWSFVDASTVSGVAPSSLGNSILGANDQLSARVALGLGSIASQSNTSIELTGGNINGVAIGGASASSGNFSSLVVSGNTLLGSSNTTFVKGDAAGGNVWFAGNLISKSATYSLGTASHPWQEIYATDLVSTSDERLKKDIEPLEYGLDAVMKLNPVCYNWKNRDTSNKTLGLLAQDVENVISEVVNTADDEIGSRGIRYSNLIPVLIKAIQDQQVVIHNQEELIKSQQAVNQAYDLRLRRLESGSGSN